MAETNRRIILCVDDEPDVVDALSDTFMEIYDVRTANSGKDAMKIFLEEDISLIITDQRMPDMEGTELLAKVNSTKPICKKILLTGYSDINAASDAINTGAVDKYLSKPWDDDELISVTKALLEDIETDEFVARMTGDIENFKEKMKDATDSAELYGKFLENFPSGICLVGENETIAYVNKNGLELLELKELYDVKGRPLSDIFSVDEPMWEQFRTLHRDRDLTPCDLEVKLNQGGGATMQASITFADAGDMLGIVFNK